jgi:hypothetical protein
MIPMLDTTTCYFFHPEAGLAPLNVNRDKRREFDSPACQKKRPEQVDWRLTQAARARVVRTLENYGNVVDEAQHSALLCVVACFTMLAAGVKTGRYAYDLVPGYGKTEAVIAWCSEAYRYTPQRGRKFTALICSTKVMDLCAIKAKLIAQGVPEQEIGLVHSKRYPAEVPFPRTDDNDHRQFLLCTHERVRRDDGTKRYELRDGKRRDLVIWDESLLIGEQRAETYFNVASAIGGTLPLLQKDSLSADRREALEYLKSAWGLLESEWQAQKDTGRDPRPIELTEASPDAIARMIAALPSWNEVKVDKGPLKFILKNSQEPMRVVYGERGGFVQYDIVIPSEFENIAVLDASYGIRTLLSLPGQSGLRPDPHYEVVKKMYPGKRYDAVTLHHLSHPAGRNTIEASFRKKGANMIAEEVVNWVRRFPETEPLMILTHKKKDQRDAVDIPGGLKAALAASGIDIHGQVEVELRNPTTGGRERVMKPRFGWLTFGQETSSNDYTYIRNGLSVGAYYRDLADLAGAACGQMDDLMAPIDAKLLRDLELGEIAHSQFQGMNRCGMRECVNGQAQPTSWWFMFEGNALTKELLKAMPGARTEKWEATYLEDRTTKVDEVERAIVAHLDGLPLGPTKVSLTAIKAAIDYGGSNTVFQAGRDHALIERPEWKLEGRSLIRN